MKLRYRHILAGLIASAALVQAQISTFTVSSDAGTGNDLQIAGLATSQNALLQITTNCPSPGYSNLTNYFSNYYTLNTGVGGTVLCPQTSGYTDYWTTTVTNIQAPNQGFTSAAPIYNCSGRFRIEPGYWSYEWVEDYYGGYYDWVYYSGTTATLTFTVADAASFSVQAVGSSLASYGLTGLESPQVALYGPNGYVTSVNGEGTSSAQYLQPGVYTAYVSGADDTSGGITVVSINKQ